MSTHQPPAVTRTLTLDQFHNEARARFGPDQRNWAYQCPTCGDIATYRDARLAIALARLLGGDTRREAGQVLAQTCVNCPAQACEVGTTMVRLDNGQEARVFELAPAPLEETDQ